MNVGAVNSKLLVNSLYCALQKIFILNIYFHSLKISKAQQKKQHLRFVREYAQVFVLGHDRFLEARTSPWPWLSENCLPLGTDHVWGQVSLHTFAPNGGCCLFRIQESLHDACSYVLPAIIIINNTDDGKNTMCSVRENLIVTQSRFDWILKQKRIFPFMRKLNPS